MTDYWVKYAYLISNLISNHRKMRMYIIWKLEIYFDKVEIRGHLGEELDQFFRKFKGCDDLMFRT